MAKANHVTPSSPRRRKKQAVAPPAPQTIQPVSPAQVVRPRPRNEVQELLERESELRLYGDDLTVAQRQYQLVELIALSSKTAILRLRDELEQIDPLADPLLYKLKMESLGRWLLKAEYAAKERLSLLKAAEMMAGLPKPPVQQEGTDPADMSLEEWEKRYGSKFLPAVQSKQ